jgi:FkbM family methyltransferase
MNKLIKTRLNYESKSINKVEYIDEMYKIHKNLFDYSQFLPQTGIYSIEIIDGKVIMTFRESNVKMICIEDDKRIACIDSINFLSYEEDELLMQYSLIEENDVVFDIGGNYGWYSIHIAKKFPNNKIYTFEPLPNTFSTLINNINLNDTQNINPINIGLSKEKGEFTFYCDPNLTVNASLTNVGENSNAIEVKCKVDVLDSFVMENSIKKLDFIKCDIEGAELFALLGAKKSILEFKPKIFIEMLRKWSAKFGYHPNDIISYLKDLGYSCYIINGHTLLKIFEVTENTHETNFVFLHNTAHIKLINQLAI